MPMSKSEYESWDENDGVEALHDKIVELESMHQELEANHHLGVSVLLAFIFQMYWHNWLITVPLSLLIYLLLRRFFAEKIATTSVDKSMAKLDKKRKQIIEKLMSKAVNESLEELEKMSLAELERIDEEIEVDSIA